MLADRLNQINEDKNNADFAVRCELAASLFECQGYDPVAPSKVASRFNNAAEMVASMNISEVEYNRAWEAAR